MSEQKPHQFRPPLYSKEGSGSEQQRPGAKDQQGWDAYRKWLSRVNPKAAAERAPLDPSIYSWRGYHTWADKIRQSWKDN
jgi:hypothetical protein